MQDKAVERDEDSVSQNAPVTTVALDKATGIKWRPAVRSVLALVALLPLLGIAVLTGISASNSWSNRQFAQKAAKDVALLKEIAQARLQMNNAAVPMILVASANTIGITEQIVSLLVGINLMRGSISLPEAQHLLSSSQVFVSTPTLKADDLATLKLNAQIEAGHGDYATATATLDKFANALDSYWISKYQKLESDVSAWNPPGTFETHLSALRQTYATFDAGIYSDRDAIDVLEGIGGAAPKLQLTQESYEFQQASQQFLPNIGASGLAAWNKLNRDPHVQVFNQVIQNALKLVQNGGPAPFLTNEKAAGVAVRGAIYDVADLSNLVQSAANDLVNQANHEASVAKEDFILEIVFLLALLAFSIGGVLIVGRSLTKPLQALSGAALKIHSGDFDLEELDDAGPKEVATTTEAFNVMSTTLKAVERKTVALAEEDLEHADLSHPLPGKTGAALQAAVDQLAKRIKEREEQRQQLYEAATHDRLTSLLNRAAVFDYLTTNVTERRKSGESVAVLFVDIDGLKPLNDEYGHEAGDAAIKATGEALVEATDSCDVVGRLGGDEFLSVLCPEHSKSGAEVSERMRAQVARKTITANGKSVSLQASVGIALAECDASTDPMELVKLADQRMYEAKRAARVARS